MCLVAFAEQDSESFILMYEEASWRNETCALRGTLEKTRAVNYPLNVMWEWAAAEAYPTRGPPLQRVYVKVYAGMCTSDCTFEETVWEVPYPNPNPTAPRVD